MKLLGSNDDGGGRGPPIRTQDDAAVGYVFQRHPHDQEFPQFAQKQPRWASGDDAIIDNQDKWKYNPSLINTTQTCGGGVQLQTTTNSTNLIKPMQMQSQQQQQQQHHQMHQQQNHNSMGLQQNHMNTQQMLNHALNNSGGGLPPPPPQMQMPPQMTQGGMYDHMHSVNLNGVGGPKEQQQQLVYLGGQPPMSVLAPQNQYMTAARNAAISTSAAKKLWEKGGGDVKVPSHGSSGLTPLQLHGGPEHQVWRDSTWSTQGEPILAPRRSAYQQAPVDVNQTGSVGILSPRDSTGGLGVKMVEYVLGGSPTNKESPLTSLEPRLRNLKFDDNDKSIDDKEKSNSPFDSNGLKKEETTTNGVMNGIDDDKGFNRTPGSRQPSPAEEALQRPNNNILDGSGQIGGGQMGGGGGSFQQHNLQHMLSGVATSGNDLQSCHLGSYHHQLQMNQLQAPVLNGVSNMHPAIQQNQMVNQQQGLNQVDSSANLLQQQHNFDVQQLFRSQNPGLAANGGGQGAPNGQSLQALPLPSQQFLAQQNAYAAPQAAPYVINPGQDATQYMGLIPSMPQYYNLPWPVYPGNLIPQQGTQPRRPLTPSQQGQPDYQIVPFYENSQILMGPRNGTQMRLVSPASVMVPPGAPRAPQVPSIYPPQPQTAQQSLYSTQNGSSVGGLALNTSSLSARRDSFDRNTSAFSPSLDYTSSANSNSGINSGVRKWPVGSYGALGTVATASASPLAPAITPPPSLGGLVSNRAPGAETKYRNVNQLAPVGLSANAMFGSNNSLFSKMTAAGSVVRPTTTASAAAAVAAAAAATAASSVTPLDQQRQQGRSRLLEDFRNQRFPNLQLRDLANHIVEFSQDQHGSRFIQQKLERATVTEKQMVFNEILNAAYSLMTDVFGNYVIQKFFEFGTPEQKSTLANQIKGHVLPLALQMYGCRVIQKALESITTEQQQEIVRELDGHVLKCVKDQNGNHVVQKCIECVEAGALQFIINAFGSQVYSLSTHPYGCRVIQRILEHCTQEQTAPILAELHSHTDQLIQDQYGNYVIQHVLEHGKQEDKSALIAAVRNKVLVLSQHKFASNVVEKCVTHATRSERALLLEEVCSFNDNALHIMMKDQYANYVIQKMIDVSEPTQRKIIMHKIKPHVNLLKKYTYGKHIIAKLEKFFQKNSQPMQIGNLGGNESLGPIGPPPTNGVL